MKNDPLDQALREAAWRRPLTAGEQAKLDAWLKINPDARTEWELDAALSQALARLPEQPVASNFTARVLDAIEREDLAAAGARRESSRLGWLRSLGWVPRAAVAVVVLAVGLLGWQQVRSQREAQALERFVAATEATPMPSPEVFQDYETIIHIMPPGAADVSLLTLMQ
jgi:negative regulator of sigma E activity